MAAHYTVVSSDSSSFSAVSWRQHHHQQQDESGDVPPRPRAQADGGRLLCGAAHSLPVAQRSARPVVRAGRSGQGEQGEYPCLNVCIGVVILN